MATARDTIKKALRKIGAIGVGESVPSDTAVDALDTLNDMIDSWSVEGLLVFTETRETLTLTSGQTTYTIGEDVGNDFNTVRPIRIVSAFVRRDNIDYPIKIIDKIKYDQIVWKSLSYDLPQFLYYDANYPAAKLFLYGAPGANYDLHITAYKPLARLSALATTLSVPPGYDRAFVYNLAIELATEYGRPIPPEVIKIAEESKATIQRGNIMNDDWEMDSGLQTASSFNVYSGPYV